MESDAEAQATLLPESSKLADLSALVRKMMAKKKRVADLETELKAEEEQLAAVQKKEIPDLMLQLNVSSFTTEDGLFIKVAKKYFAGISSEKSDEAIAWLVDNNHADLIKIDVVSNFTKGQAQKAEELMSILGANGFTYKSKQFVHPMTLKSFVKGELEDGHELPLELFGVYVENVAEVKVK